MKKEWISKAEASRRLAVSDSMISRYIRRGAPCRNDGRLPWPEFQDWVKSNIVAALSGNYHHRMACKELAGRDAPRSTASNSTLTSNSQSDPPSAWPVVKNVSKAVSEQFYCGLRALGLSERDAYYATHLFDFRMADDKDDMPASTCLDESDWARLAPNLNLDEADEIFDRFLGKSNFDAFD